MVGGKGRKASLRFCSLASGSRGNATVVEKGGTCVLVDCGLSAREVSRRLTRIAGRCPEALTAILVTHEHTDHLRGVSQLAKAHGLPVWATTGTAARLDAAALAPYLRVFDCHRPFTIDDLHVEPYPVPHDAREPSQFVFGDGSRRLGVLTDAGSVTPHIESVLDGCDALLLECNHDDGMLASSPYPERVKERIAGRYGHLNNEQAAQLLERLDCSRLQHVIGAHLSETNNTPELVRAALSAALGCAEDWIGVADQEAGLGWREIA